MNRVPNQHADANPFEVSKRRSRRRALVGLLAIFVVLAGLGTYVILADPARVLRSARPALESQKARYCNVLEAEKRRGKTNVVPTALGEPIVETWLSFNAERDPSPFGNAEAIEPEQLEQLCGGRPPSSGQVFRAMLPWMLMVDELKYGPRFERKAALHAVEGTKEVRYLVVVTVDRFTASTATGGGGLSSGDYAGTAAIYRLADTTCLGTVAVNGREGSVAFVSGRRDASGHVSAQAADSDLGHQSTKHFERAIEEAFAAQGVKLKLGL